MNVLKKIFTTTKSKNNCTSSLFIDTNMVDGENVCCGLVKIIRKGEDWEPPIKSPIPLISVDVNASVVHAVAQVEVTQVYVNKEEQPIEAIYYFPVNPDGAVTHFQAELEGRVIKGTVKPQKEAKEVYDKAVEDKTTAFLGEETKADIFKVRVGFLKPGSQVKVIIGYVTEVKNEPGSNAIRFYIPTTVAPRYVSPSETDDKAKDIKEMKFSPSSPAPLTLKVAVSLLGKIKSIESPTHSVKIEKTGLIPENPAWEKAVVNLAGESSDMDRDFVLTIVPEEVHKPRLYSEKLENGSTAAMLHLVPSFKLDEQKTEIIFVLDRSGSMMGQSIDLARNALLLFLHSMPADCYFNVIGFGSTYKFLFPTSVKYDDSSLKKAISHAKGLQADLGGTEILEPLKDIYGKPGIDGYLRQIFILTDGEVSNTDAVLGIAQAHAHKARVFALGIGDGASHYLVEGIAKAGGGTSAFVTYNESIEKKVLNQLKNGLQPSLTDIELEWEGLSMPPVLEKAEAPINKEKTLLGYNKPILDADVSTEKMDCTTSGVSSKQSPKRIPPVYDGSQLLVFGLFKDEIPKSVNIKAQSPDGPLTFKVEYSADSNVGSNGMLHRLAAVKLIRELELESAALHFQGLADPSKQEEILKKEIIEIGCLNGITSKYTSFVAVDESSDKPSNENWVMESRHVPSQFSHGWHGGMFAGGMQPQMMMCSAPSAAFRSAPLGSGFGAPMARMACKSRSKRACSSGPTAYFLGGAQAAPEISNASTDSIPTFATLLGPSDPITDPSNIQCEMSDECVDEDDKSASPLVKMISLQSFDGSYALDAKLCNILEKSEEGLQQAASERNLEASVLATALAISYFLTKLAAEKDVWDLVVLKARKWLKKAVAAEKVDDVLQMAASLL